MKTLPQTVRGGIALIGILLFGGASTGCALLADEEQQRIVRENLTELPEDVSRALRPGKIRMHYHGPAGTDVRADRGIRLTVGEPPPVTAGRWVAGCQAMTAALAPTSGRLYGQLPGDTRRLASTDALCQRGLGHPLGNSDAPELWIGLPQPDGRVLDTGVNYNAANNTIETFGWRVERRRGSPITVSEHDPAELDRAVAPVRLPWRAPTRSPGQAEPKGQVRTTFVVPTGTRLQVLADCGEQAANVHMQWHVQDDANYLSFSGGAPADRPGSEVETESCAGSLLRPLRPQLSYRLATGAQVDRYVFVAFLNPDLSRAAERPQRGILVTRAS